MAIQNHYYRTLSHSQHLCDPVAHVRGLLALALSCSPDQKCDNFRLESLTWSGARTAF